MKKHILSVSVAFIAFFMSCTPPVYLPNSLNVPLLEKKEEVNAGLNKMFDSYDLQISRAISDNIGLMFNGTYLSYRRTKYYRTQTFGEFGIGLFSPQCRHLVGEIYVGAGIGSNSFKENIIFESADAHVSTNYIRLFLQSVFGTRTEGIECGVSMRICYLNFYQINYSNIDFPRKKTLFEPVVFMRFGPPFIQIQTQFGYSLDPNRDPLQIPFSDEWIAGIGFNIRPDVK